MTHRQYVGLPRWEAHVATRNTFLSCSFSDELDEYEPTPLRRSISMPGLLCVEARSQEAELMIDESFEPPPGEAPAYFWSSESDDAAEAGNAESAQQELSRDASSDVSTDAEQQPRTCQVDKIKRLVKEIVGGRSPEDKTCMHSGAQLPTEMQKSKREKNWRPCKGARVRFRKLLDRLMNEFDTDPQARKFKDAHYLSSVEPGLAESTFREVVRSRLSELLRRKDYSATGDLVLE